MKTNFILIIMLLAILTSCNEDIDFTERHSKKDIHGVVQKGPFISGTSISVNELNSDLSQTGKIFQSQIIDNRGSFELKNVELDSGFVSLRASGFYYNEILGEPSAAQLTLNAISDISDKNSVNINILSHLEKPRVEYLFSEGMDFASSKEKAQSEILKIFEINETPGRSSEQLDISQSGEDNAILLAVSAILQGFRTEAELTELLSEISLDLKEDGVLNNQELGSKLMNHSVFLSAEQIKNNLEARYTELGVNTEVPSFEKYINQFVENSSFEITESLIDYPDHGIYGPNILATDTKEYSNSAYSLAAYLPRGSSLKIKVSVIESGGHWYYSGGSEKNWKIDSYSFEESTQLFTALDSDESCDLRMLFDPGEFLIEYFEMGAAKPTRTKIITVE